MGLGTVWGPLIAWYLFLAGVGAGAYLVGVGASTLGTKYQPLVRPGILLGAPLVAIGSGLLLLDLGNPIRFYLGFLRPQSSMISVGILIITVFILLGLLHIAALLWPSRVKLSARALAWLGGVNAVFALATAIYTGLLLGVVKAVPFWNTPMLPLLFLVSALSTGAGAILLALAVWRLIRPVSQEQAEQLVESEHLLSRVDIPLIAVELLVLFFLLFLMGGGPSMAAESARYLVTGGFAVAFWVGLVVVGLLVPAVLEAWSLRGGQALNVGALAGVCLLIGGIVLRYAVLSAGASVATAIIGG
ncbi:MAG TPA: NrfD/PsrC family molybdoenzyme membrane anchor subunit [Anaerolineae bacterium]